MIFTSLSPNTQKDDLQLACKNFFKPFSWQSGETIAELEAAFRRFLPASFAFSFISGRTALLAILKSLGIKEGDEVLIQAYTCVAAVAPILWCGARPVYVDCGPDFNLSPEDLAKKITPRCKAIIVQHTFGRPAQLEKIISLAIEHNLFLIEDGAHALGSIYQKRKIGTFGIASFWSFGRDKVISSTFGGMVTTNDDGLAQKISLFRSSLPYPGKIWIGRQLLHPLILWLTKKTYNFLALGKIILELAKKLKIISLAVETKEKIGAEPSFLLNKMPNALAGLALNQFKKLEQFNAHRKNIAAFYTQALKSNSGIILPPTMENSENIYLRYTLLSPQAPAIIQEALQKGIELGNWYNTPIAPAGVDYAKVYYTKGSCPQAEKLSGQSFNLPTHIQLTEKDAQKIVDFLKNMPLKISEIDSKEQWENFLLEARPHTFLHSWNYGEFQKKLGQKIFRLAAWENDKLVGLALIIKVAARRGIFLHCPHGPIIKDGKSKKDILQEFFVYLKNLAQKESCHFLRISPLLENSAENKILFQNFGFKAAPIHMHPELAWLLDISPSEEELIGGMRKTTRYCIKKATKDGVEIIQSSDVKDLEEFWKIYEDTSRRQHFTPFSWKYLQSEWETFSKDNQAVLFFGKYRGELISTALIIFDKSSGFYHQGASLQKYAKIPASYLLQWEAIREAKKRNCQLYNFWGVSPEKETTHPWAGLSLFKKGFGGYLESYVESQDLILSPFYYFYFLVETFRKIKRGF